MFKKGGCTALTVWGILLLFLGGFVIFLVSAILNLIAGSKGKSRFIKYQAEKEAAENYILNTEKMYFQIKENGEIVKATVENHKKEIKVPNTLSIDYLPIICSFTIIAGTIIYMCSKNKRIK